MRVSKLAAAENRQRILHAAAELLREHGVDGAGVDAITEAAGLTHGAFYSRFGAKEEVVTEALRLALDEARELWARHASGPDKRGALEKIIDVYQPVEEGRFSIVAESRRSAPIQWRE